MSYVTFEASKLNNAVCKQNHALCCNLTFINKKFYLKSKLRSMKVREDIYIIIYSKINLVSFKVLK